LFDEPRGGSLRDHLSRYRLRPVEKRPVLKGFVKKSTAPAFIAWTVMANVAVTG